MPPPPGDQTFRYSPSRGIGLSALAPPGGSRAIPRDCWKILPEHAVALKGQPVKNVSMVEQYYPKTMTFMLVIFSSLKKKVDPSRGATPWDRFEFELIGEFKFIFEKAVM
jgi:hypothetical protein